LELVLTTAGTTVLTPEQVAIAKVSLVLVPEVAEVAEKVVAKVKEVIFFWIEGRNQQFIVPSGKMDAQGKSIKGVNYKTVNSVIKLDPVKDAGAIKHLQAHAKNEVNGGRIFKQMESLSLDTSERGNTMDKLLGYGQKTLAEMAGGGIDNQRLSVGELIVKLMDKD
jgi:hypothetical protein